MGGRKASLLGDHLVSWWLSSSCSSKNMMQFRGDGRLWAWAFPMVLPPFTGITEILMPPGLHLVILLTKKHNFLTYVNSFHLLPCSSLNCSSLFCSLPNPPHFYIKIKLKTLNGMSYQLKTNSEHICKQMQFLKILFLIDTTQCNLFTIYSDKYRKHYWLWINWLFWAIWVKGGLGGGNKISEQFRWD